MSHLYESEPLWKNALAVNSLDNELTARAREKLRVGYYEFRKRVEILIAQIQKELPDLTLHDIQHVDAIWGVASTVAGEGYPLNPAEAFVLGGAFLLHDAAHCCAAFKGGFEEIKQTNEWKAAALAKGLAPSKITKNDPQYQSLLFETLRTLHPVQAEKLPFAVWGDTPESASFLLPDEDLRKAYGHVIGAVAKSHWSYPHELEAWWDDVTTTPVCLAGTNWQVDWLKLAVLLRVADALHMDSQRAPDFLLKIAPPSNETSKLHWDFQSHLKMIACDSERQEIKIDGNPFPADKQAAWWQAYDTARMADKELDSAYYLLRDNNRPLLAAREIAGVRSPEAFARYVKAQGWTPVDTEVRITHVQQIVKNFGGEKLYGDKPHLALRELLQNAIDAVHACRKLGELDEDKGEIEIELDEPVDGKQWLHVTDTGIGMSKYVLTQVLLDFGRSLWGSRELKGEWSDLAASHFDAIGQFGIGFFSVFMLGEQVKVITRRCVRKDGEPLQWALEFSKGTEERPVLRAPKENEKLKRHGTRVSVLVNNKVLYAMRTYEEQTVAQLMLELAPALDIDLYLKNSNETFGKRKKIADASDWLALADQSLQDRILPPRGKLLAGAFTEIKNAKNEVVGRLRVPSDPYRTFASGVRHGLRTAQIHGLFGIIQCVNQSLLARNDATPAITLTDLQRWANLHKKDILLAGKPLGFVNSALLAFYGADHSDLILGEFDGETVTCSKLIDKLKDSNEVIYHDGWVDLDEEDSIARNQHESFEPVQELLQSNTAHQPEWLKAIDDQSRSRETWSIDSAITQAVAAAWGDDLEWVQERTVVGCIEHHEIERLCWVARRPSSLEI